jgi:hypothetical protein
VRAHHGSSGHRTPDYSHWTTLSFQSRTLAFMIFAWILLCLPLWQLLMLPRI